MLTPSPGTQLFKEGDSAAVFLVDTGEVEVYRGTAAKPRVVGRVGPGSVPVRSSGTDIAVFEHTAHKWSAPAVGSCVSSEPRGAVSSASWRCTPVSA